MAIDKLQDKIRKLKNPSVVDFSITPDLVPPHILQSEGSFLPAYERFCMELMGALKATVPAVRFGLDYFALFGLGFSAFALYYRRRSPCICCIFFIILLVCSNCLRKRFTSTILVPEPLAIRFLRLPLSN